MSLSIPYKPKMPFLIFLSLCLAVFKDWEP